MSKFKLWIAMDENMVIVYLSPPTLAALITVAVYDCALSPQAPPRD